MLFNSFLFLLLFLPVVVLGYALLRKYLNHALAQAFLLLSSLVFYGYAEPKYLPILLGSILFNWAFGVWIGSTDATTPEGEKKRKFILWLGITVDIALLCSFKYVNFMLRHIPFLRTPSFTLPDWAFPLGISFYTLTQVMYLVDTYQGLNSPNSLFDHATLVSLFPYVESGPLVRSRSVVPQFKRFTMRGDRLELACRGLYLLTLGLAKKVILADSFARVADVGFGSTQNVSTLEAWLISLCYTFQLYYDFSGYSDMAVGCAWMLGIDIPQNFNAPYRSKSISEFWQRWHISLSNFITNYLYTPILRSMGRATLTTSVIAVLLAMSIAGLWHGPAWTFIIFGTLHGIALAGNQIWKKRKLKMQNWLGWLLTFVFADISLVFFRSPNVPFALHLLKAMLPHHNLFGDAELQSVLPLTSFLKVRPITIGIVLAFFFATSQQLADRFRPSHRTAFGTALLIVCCLFFLNSTAAKEFIYFAF